MKKLTSLMMLFCGFAANALAGPTDLPTITESGSEPVWYAIKNVRQSKYATYAGDAATMTQQAAPVAASFFYLTNSETEGAVKIHNYAAGEKLCAAYNSWTEQGIDWYLKVQATGVSICTSTSEWNAWNDAGGSGQKVEYWSASDAGSSWEFIQVTDFSTVLDLVAAKDAAKAKLDNYAAEPAVYPSAEAAKAEIDAIVAADNSLKELSDAIEKVNAVVTNYLKGAFGGKYYSIYTPARADVNCGYMRMNATNVTGTATLNSPANIWQFVADNGFVKVFNPYTGKYLGEPGGNSSNISVVDAATAANYTLEVNASASNADAKIKLTCNGKSVHMAVGGNLVRWDDGGASEWTISEVTDFTDIATAYKVSAINTLDQWATLSVVFDAATISAAKTSINAISTTSWESFAAIDAELKKATDNVATKMFTFQTKATDNHRNGVWVSANMSTSKAIGAHSQDYNAIWSLRHAGGTSFYLYNELNSVYVGKPSANCPLTAEPTTPYSFEIIDAANGVVEMKTSGETLHASNHNDDKLLSWDGDEPASRWYIRTIDVASDIQVILDALTEDDYAEVPALGQYPKAAYDALVEARTSAKTVEDVQTAIAKFKTSKNMPVFMITGVKDYVLGKSIYEDVEEGKLKFKTTDRWDKTMWWALDMTSITVGVTEEIGIYNVGTGNGFWGASSIKITETSENEGAGIPDDGIFLFYTTGNGTPIHYQASDQSIVRYGSTEANSGSAHIFTYIGNSHELKNLTEEDIALILAKEDLEAYIAELGTVDHAAVPALGQYTTAAYNALLDAKNAATVDEMSAAINNFKRSKNLPIFTISGVKDYVVGKSIYDDNDGAPNFKTTNKWDKTMWWALDMTSTTVGVTEEVGIYNVGTGNGFWGASSIKITETSENEGAGIPDDGIFLFYTTGSGTPIHYQNDNQVIVRWNSTEANSGSAHIFTYIGNTYDIADITEEEIALIIAKENLDAYIAELGTVDHAAVPALGQYTTAAYNALLDAKNAATDDEIYAAINNFKRSKNLPVFMISGVIDYAYGKSIYEREDGELHFQKTNKWDKTMWWVLDMTATTIGVAEKVDIYNYASGNGFLGASSIKITETEPADENDNIFLFYTTDNNTTVHYQRDYNKIVRWDTKGADSGSAHIFTYIGTTRDLNGLSNEHLAALSEFRAVYTSSSAYSSVKMGDGVGQYSGDKSLLDAAIAEAQTLYNKTDAEYAAMQVSEIEAVTAALLEGVAALSLNMPTAGFYRIVSQNATDEAKRGCYWQVNEAGDAMELNKTQDETRSMFYLSETNQLVNYDTGAAINGVTTVDALGTAANSWNITKNNAVLSTYALQFENKDASFLSDWTGVSTYGLNDDNAAWKFEPVTVVPVAVTAAGYATFFSPVAVTLPEDVEAYVATATTSNAMGLSIISNKVIPANTGVILVANPGTYELTVGGEAEEELTSVLKGTVAATYITDESYILAQKNGVVGMYKALFNISTDQTNDGEEGVEDDTYEAFLNNGFKAYLPKPAGSEARFFVFSFGGETGIVETENGNVNTDNVEIYDLSGRRIVKAQKGIFIVNGKKVIR